MISNSSHIKHSPDITENFGALLPTYPHKNYISNIISPEREESTAELPCRNTKVLKELIQSYFTV